MNEIRISGFGGQGVIRCGYIIGKTADLFDGKHATLSQSFGPEARGSACSAQIIVDDDPLRYPYLTTPDTVVAMSQEAYDKFEPDLKGNDILLIEEDLVTPHPPRQRIRIYSVPATRIAEELGRRIVANVVLQDTELYTLPLGLKMFQGSMQTQWGLYAAGSMLVSVPVVALFLFLSRYLISGLTLGAVKG